METDIRITRARAILIREHPFFGALAGRLIVRERTDIKTLATDGTFLFYCLAFLARITEPELVFCVAHEVLHCALSHMTRRGNRPWDLWQAATDYVVNIMLHDAGFKVPHWVKYFDEKYRGLSVEQVCQLLQQEQEKEQENQQQDTGGLGSIDHMPNQNEDDGEPEGDPDWDMPPRDGDDEFAEGDYDPDDFLDKNEEAEGHADGEQAQAEQGEGGSATGRVTSQTPNFDELDKGQPQPAPSFGDPGGCGEVLDAAPPHEQAKLDNMADEWQVFTRQATNIARRAGAGKLPGFIEEVIGELDRPKTDWREELRQFVDPQSSTKDFSWSRPDRRMMSMGYYQPGLISDGINHVAMIVDSSYSIDTDWLRKFGAEVQSALDEGAIDKLTLMFADDGVRRTTEYQKGEVIDFTVPGRGGTAFAPSFAWINKNAPDVAAAIYLTDLDCTAYGPEPSYPVLWAAYDSDPRALTARMERVPFGRVVELMN